MSFFMLLVVSLGLSVVRESLGRTMLKCQGLAIAHFIFGSTSLFILTSIASTSQLLVLYAVGIVELELESTSALLLLLFIIPLAFTLSGFLLWIMYSLNGVCSLISKNSLFDTRISHDCAFTREKAALQTQDVYTTPLHPFVYGGRNCHILRSFINVVLRKTCGRCVSVIRFAVHSF